MTEAETRTELRRIVLEAVRLYQKGSLSETDFYALVRHAMALEIKVTLDAIFARVNNDLNSWMERNSERRANGYRRAVDL